MRRLIVVSLIIIIVFTFTTSYWLIFPLHPKSWDKIIVGMSEHDVIKLVSGTFTSPIGLEASGSITSSKEVFYGLGIHGEGGARFHFIEIEYDNIGKYGMTRKVVNIKQESGHMNLLRFYRELLDKLY